MLGQVLVYPTVDFGVIEVLDTAPPRVTTFGTAALISKDQVDGSNLLDASSFRRTSFRGRNFS